MKTISKILSVVLVLSMLLGFALIGRAATTGDQVVINQIYWGGGNKDASFKNDFVELYNPTNAAISLDGYFLQQASKTGTSWNTVALTGSIPAKGYYLIVCQAGSNDAPAIPVAADVSTNSINMGAEMKLALINGEANKFNSGDKGSATATGVVDFFGSGAANVYEGTVKSAGSGNTSAYHRTNGVDTDNNSADFTIDTPNPHSSGASSHTHDYSNATPTYTAQDQFKHTITKNCADFATCGGVDTKDDYHTFNNKKCKDCGYQPEIKGTVTISEANTKAAAAGSAYTTEWWTVTGKVKSIASSTYGNMYIVDEAGNELYIYGLYMPDTGVRFDSMETKPQVGDTITIAATLGTYTNSSTNETTNQAKSAWLMNITAAECEHTTVTDYVCEACGNPVPPAADTKLTYAEVEKLAAAMQGGTTSNKYYVEGVVTEVTNTTYGNMIIKDDAGNTLVVYGSYDEKGEKRYDAMENPPAVGDTIKVYGAVGSYNGKAEIINGWVTVTKRADSNSNPKDGDAAMLIPMMIVMAMSATGMGLVIKKKSF